MFHYLETREDIARAQRQLEATVRRGFSQIAVRDIGYPGGRERRARVATDGHYWFWSRDHRASSVFTPRRLNWFGVLSQKSGVSITVEVNTVYKARNDRAAGFFVRDTDTGIVYFLHSGRLGGGAKGVGKNGFLTWATLAKRPLVQVVDSSGNSRDGLVVMPVSGVSAIRSAIQYIDLVRRFKTAARNGELSTKRFQRQQKKFEDYFTESRGRRTGRRTSQIDYITRHGDIVDALHTWRKSRPMPRNSRVVKNLLIDMGVAIGRTLIEIFEVKPKTNRPSLYSALGQLLVHGTKKDCRRTIVLPNNKKIPSDVAAAIERLKIKILRFELDQESAKIL